MLALIPCIGPALALAILVTNAMNPFGVLTGVGSLGTFEAIIFAVAF